MLDAAITPKLTKLPWNLNRLHILGMLCSASHVGNFAEIVVSLTKKFENDQKSKDINRSMFKNYVP